jgi:hypothetical protein
MRIDQVIFVSEKISQTWAMKLPGAAKWQAIFEKREIDLSLYNSVA